jgi:hypothetical protein
MRGEGCNPIQDGKDGEVFLEDRVHLRAIENRFRLLLVSDFLQRKWGTQNILGKAFLYPAVPAFDFDLIVNAEIGIFSGEELFDQLSLILFSLSKSFRALWRKRLSSFFMSISGRT